MVKWSSSMCVKSDHTDECIVNLGFKITYDKRL